MKFLTNLYDPKRPDARHLITTKTKTEQTKEEAWHEQEKWLRGKVIGIPEPANDYTARELTQMGYVEVYAPD